MSDKPTIEQILSIAKQELLALVAQGKVPMNIHSFAALHDCIDANVLGGFCDDEKVEQWIAALGGRDEHDGWPRAFCHIVNGVQAELDRWIKDGGVIKGQHPKVWLLLEIGENVAPCTVFSSQQKAFLAGIEAIEGYRHNSKVADQIDEVLASFREFGRAGDDSAVFWVEVKQVEVK